MNVKLPKINLTKAAVKDIAQRIFFVAAYAVITWGVKETADLKGDSMYVYVPVVLSLVKNYLATKVGDPNTTTIAKAPESQN